MSILKVCCVVVSLLSIAACDGVKVAPDEAANENIDAINPETPNATVPHNGLTFANTDQALTPRTRLDESLNRESGSSFDQIQDEIIVSKCSACHTGGEKELPGSMNFSSASATYASLINVQSTEYPQLSLVAPGMSTKSYLVNKIEGTQLVGKQMPLSGGYLSKEQILLIKRWINSGAAR